MSEDPDDPRPAWLWVVVLLGWALPALSVVVGHGWLLARVLQAPSAADVAWGSAPATLTWLAMGLWALAVWWGVRWRRLSAVVVVYVCVLWALLNWPLQEGIAWTGSPVRWSLAVWTMELEGITYAETLLKVQVGSIVGATVVAGLLAIVGPFRRRAWLPLIGALGLGATSYQGAFGGRVPDYLAMDPLLYTAKSRAGWDHLGAVVWGRPVPAGMALQGVGGERWNVVYVFMESVGSNAVTPSRPELGTTPFLSELAARSLFVPNMLVSMTSTYKAHLAGLCGVDPWFIGDRELSDDPYPFTCLPAALRERGYETAYFTSSGREMLWWDLLVRNLGFDTYLGWEDFRDAYGERWIERWEDANSWAYEDDILLRPSRDWHERHLGVPFVVGYMATTPHYEYLAPTRYGRHRFSVNDEYNRYLNSVHYLDNFLRNLFEQYEDLGLLDRTVFVLVGDHGEAFGEHLPLQHNAVPYDEVVRVPAWIVAPGHFAGGQVVTGLASQLDLAPTVYDLLGLRYDAATSDGLSLVKAERHEGVGVACLYMMSCAAWFEGNLKYVHHFGERPDELFDVVADPAERRDVVAERPEDAARMRQRVLGWYMHADPGREPGPLANW